MLILGLDLGLDMGWCLLRGVQVEGCGTFQIAAPDEGRKSEVRWQRECMRLRVLSRWLREFRANYGAELSSVAHEAIRYGGQDGRARFDNYGAQRGQIHLVFGDLCPVVYVQPSTVKLRVAGHGRADKNAVRHAVNLRFGLSLTEAEHNTADAVAIAATHYQNKRDHAE